MKENNGKDNHLWNQIRKQQAIETDKLEKIFFSKDK